MWIVTNSPLKPPILCPTLVHFCLYYYACLFTIFCKLLFAPDQYQFLKKEVKRLKKGLTNYSNNKFRAYFGSTTNNVASRLDAMQMALDMEKLNIN